MLPNLVIAGAPKCGTTSIHRWLSAHPQSFGARQKELRYFVDEGYPLLSRHNFKICGLQGYQKFFSCKQSGEQSVFLKQRPITFTRIPP